MAAPISHTCPDIDKAIKHLDKILDEIRWISKDYPDIKRELDGIEYNVEYAMDAFEDLRKSNDQLRKWGEELEPEVEKIPYLEEEIEQLREDNLELKSLVDGHENMTIPALKEEIEDLKLDIQELQNR